MTSHPDEGTLHAYLDGEVAADEIVRLERHVAECASCAAALAEARGLVAAASRTISALDAAPASGGPTAARAISPARAPATKARPFRVPFARAAALLLLAGGTAAVVTRIGTLDVVEPPTAETFTTDASLSEDRSLPAAAVPAPIRTGTPTTTPATPPGLALRDAQANARVGSPGSGEKRSPQARAGSVAGTASTVIASPISPPPSVSAAASAAPSLSALPPPPLLPSRAAVTEESDFSGRGVAGAARVTRLRTKTGVVLTLTEEQLPAPLAEDASAARRRVARTTERAAVQSTSAARADAAAPAVNSYRWWDPRHQRSYTLTGPLSVLELEALAGRLDELERLP